MAPRDGPQNVNSRSGLVSQPRQSPIIEKVELSAALANRPARVSDRLNELARDVRRIGDGFRSTPEAIALQKDSIARELATLARQVKE